MNGTHALPGVIFFVLLSACPISGGSCLTLFHFCKPDEKAHSWIFLVKGISHRRGRMGATAACRPSTSTIFSEVKRVCRRRTSALSVQLFEPHRLRTLGERIRRIRSMTAPNSDWGRPSSFLDHPSPAALSMDARGGDLLSFKEAF